jgi:hypothetical protein
LRSFFGKEISKIEKNEFSKIRVLEKLKMGFLKKICGRNEEYGG